LFLLCGVGKNMQYDGRRVLGVDSEIQRIPILDQGTLCMEKHTVVFWVWNCRVSCINAEIRLSASMGAGE
jgi:hypothetical protein